jgi:putative ABC transport system permease protein
VAAISAHLWTTRLAADPRVLGRTLRINDEPYTVVAVMPDVIPDWMEAARPGPVEVWTPVAFPLWSSEASRGIRGGSALGRLKPGVSLDQAQADLTLVAARLAATYPVDRDVSVVVKRLADTRVGTLRPMLLLLMAAVALILLIACVNLANLLLARNATRQRELALRQALGAGRGGLVRQLLVETLLLSAAGAAVGLVFAEGGLAALARSHPPNLPQFDGIGLDWRVLAFTGCVAILTSLMFGLAPALTATRLNVVDVLKQGGRGVSSGRGRGLRNALVAAEMAMSLVLLVSASLLVQSIAHLQHQSLGIRQDHLLKGHFYLPPARYPDAAAIAHFADAFAATVRALPGVIDATITTAYPPNNGWTQMLNMARHPITRIDDVPSAQFGVADAHFLKTMGIPLVRGRDFAASDTADRPAVAIVSAEFVRRYFPNDDPLGQEIHIGPPPFMQTTPGADATDSADVTVIGVAGDFRNAGLTTRPEPHLTVLYAQHPLVNFGFKDIIVRTTAEPHLVAPAVTRELHRLDPNLPLAEVQTIGELVDQQTGGQRLTATLLAVFAGAGLALAVVGIYGVVSFLVAQRRVELAVRMAIGATARTVLWLVLRESLGMAVIGSALGLASAAGAQRLTSGLLFDVSPIDPLTFGMATLALLGIATLATLVPGVRATRIDPGRALYQD